MKDPPESEMVSVEAPATAVIGEEFAAAALFISKANCVAVAMGYVKETASAVVGETVKVLEFESVIEN